VHVIQPLAEEMNWMIAARNIFEARATRIQPPALEEAIVFDA
jgi:hypothetical protein